MRSSDALVVVLKHKRLFTIDRTTAIPFTLRANTAAGLEIMLKQTKSHLKSPFR